MRRCSRTAIFLFCLLSADFCFGQSGNEEERDSFRLAPKEAKRLGVKSSASVIYEYSFDGDTTSEFGEYYVYDRKGRVVAERNKYRLQTFRFDSLNGELAERNMYERKDPDYYQENEPHALKAGDLDSMLNNSNLVNSVLYSRGIEIRTISYYYGELGYERYVTYDKDSSARIVETANGARTVWIIRPDGSLSTDTTTSFYEKIINNYNDSGDCIRTEKYDYEGTMTSDSRTSYIYDAEGRQLEIGIETVTYNKTGTDTSAHWTQFKYDHEGREIEHVEKTGDGIVKRSTRRKFSPSGAIDSLEMRVEDGRPRWIQHHTLEIQGRDTIMTSRFLDYSSGQSISVMESYNRIHGDSSYAEGFSKTYITDTSGRIIGDTSISSGIRYYNKSGQTLSWVMTKDGKESSRMTGKYDKKGHPLEYTLWEPTRTHNETFAYHKNGKLKTHIESNGSFTLTTNYDSRGKILNSSVGPDVRLTKYTYNKNGLLILKEVFLYGKLDSKTEFTYEYY